jgi:hypothetical protein
VASRAPDLFFEDSIDAMYKCSHTGFAWSAVACVAVAIVLWVGPWIARADLFYDDAAHHVFWLYRYADPGLFPGDISVEYFRTSAPWGYRAVYACLASILDAQFAAEVLSVLLLVLVCVLVWLAANAVQVDDPRVYALFAVVATLVLLPLTQQRDALPPIAFQRSFSLPLLLVTVWALVSGRYAWVGASWIAAALIYPVILPVQGVAAAVVFMRDLIRNGSMPPRWMLNLALGVAALFIAAIGVPIPPELGPAYTYEQAMQLPEFGPHGRLQMYREGTVAYWLGGHRAGFGWPLKTLLLIAAATVLAAGLGRLKCIPLAAWAMAGVGVALWAAMRLFPEHLMFGLYLPNRHPKWALNVFGIFALAAAAAATFDALVHRWRTRSPALVVALWRGVLIGAPLLVAAALLPNAISVWKRPVEAGLEGAYAFIAELPKDTLVAAHPDLGDFVPLRARRSVLTSTEISMAWMKGYYAVMKPRVEASLRAAYATRIEDVDAALAPFGVDVMLTGPSVWEKTGYFAPFDDLAQDLLERGRREGFVLQHPPADRILFQSDGYYVIRVEPCPQGDCR